MNQTATPPDEGILAAILETLHRLEDLFNDHGQQLHNAKSAVMASEVHDSGYHLDTSDLIHSLANLHNRFEFDDCSQQDLVKTDPVDCYSISIYPSRPLSRLDLELDISPEVYALPTPLALRYEDMPPPPPKNPLRQLHSSSSTASNHPSNHSQNSPATSTASTSLRSTISGKAWSVTRAFSLTGMRRLSVRRTGIRGGTTSSDTDTDSMSWSVASIAAGQAEKLSVTGRWVRKRTRSLLRLVPRAVSAAARATINQQFKMLDVVV